MSTKSQEWLGKPSKTSGKVHYHDADASITYNTTKAMREAEARGRRTVYCAKEH